MNRGLALLGCILLLFPVAAAATPPTRAIIPGGLHSLVTHEDYPKEAIENEEQGMVAFALDIGADGMATGCTVTASSGSSALDATTCRIMKERARFRPARDVKGKPTTDRVSSRVRWVLPDVNPRFEAAAMLWASCVFGEAAKLIPGNQTAEQIAARAFPLCVGLEALLAKEREETLPLTTTRSDMVDALMAMLPKLRADLQSADVPRGGNPVKPSSPRQSP